MSQFFESAKLHIANELESDSQTKINSAARHALLSDSRTSVGLVSQELSPDNKIRRYAVASAGGIGALPSGTWNSLVHNAENPIDALTTFGMGAGTALVLKTVLPEGGLAGKLAAAGIGVYFTLKAAEPIFDAYAKAGRASTQRELDFASRQIGNAAGAFIVDSAIAAAGYKAGSHYTGRMLSSKPMDGFADAKSTFYSKLAESGRGLRERLSSGKKQLPEAGGVINSAFEFTAAERPLAGQGLLKGDLDPALAMEISVILKSQASDLKVQRTLARIAQGRQVPLTDTQFAEQFAASSESLNVLSRFALERGLKVKEANLNSGRVVLSGSSSQMANAFATRLAIFELPGGEQYIGRQGSLRLPATLRDHVTGILGLDSRPQAKPQFVKLEQAHGATLAGDRKGFMPNEVADAYNFPKESMGKGQSVAIIELGGGLDRVDNASYYRLRGLPEPKINVIEVGEAKSRPGGAFDSEVMLDSQVIGVVAPEATQNIIFAANSEKGFVDAISRATFPERLESKNSVISISWGLNEEGWSKQGLASMHEAFKKAALKGISIFASAGDDGARDRSTNGKLQAHYPASDPHVTGSGGTRLMVDAEGKYHSERVWNNGGKNDAGGGGVSEVFPPQDFQAKANVPGNANTGIAGRGVPDVAGNADPVTGYIIRVHGKEGLIGGTSAVAPLYSALMLRINGTLDKPFTTPLNPWLYQHANKGLFNDVTIGDNGGYKAGPGWDAASGLGSIDGSRMLSALKANPYLKGQYGKFRFLGPAGGDSQNGN